MHGVGCQWLVRAFETFGHQPPSVVAAQAQPDAEFSTVVFPNPEEKGALNEAIRHADAHDSSVIIANDPDADRLAVAEAYTVSNEQSHIKKWHLFSGNEIGVLLGFVQIQHWKYLVQRGENKHSQAAVLASVVSSRMLKAIALKEGIQYHDTLTGR